MHGFKERVPITWSAAVAPEEKSELQRDSSGAHVEEARNHLMVEAVANASKYPLSSVFRS